MNGYKEQPKGGPLRPLSRDDGERRWYRESLYLMKIALFVLPSREEEDGGCFYLSTSLCEAMVIVTI